MSEKLAILGGKPLITKPFIEYNTMGQEEADAVSAVVKSGVLSGFLGSWDVKFYGGPKVRELEDAWCKAFDVNHAVSVNSNTSGLIAALGAIGIEPGDEVIVSPWTMAASATSILVWNAIPVFADIDEETFNIDPKAIEAKISPYTKAIMVPDIFGQSADLLAIMAIAKKYNLIVIEDCAQAPHALYHGKKVGTIADIGVFSLNCHKHFHCGEGGICVTNNPIFAERMRLIRNHAEAVIDGKNESEQHDLVNMIGFNLRMTELQAAVAIPQLQKSEAIVERKQVEAQLLTEQLSDYSSLRLPIIRPHCTHVYYVYPLLYVHNRHDVSRKLFVDAVTAEGVPVLTEGYSNLHRMPIFQKKIAYGRHGFPWDQRIYKGHVNYDYGTCPVAERLQDHTFVKFEICAFQFSDQQIRSIGDAFRKVLDQIHCLESVEYA